MERTLLQRIHNPRDAVCACDPDCWCNTNPLGRAIKWRIPACFLSSIGIHHKNRRLEEWKRTHGQNALREWKREQQSDDLSKIVAQPKYEKIVRLGPDRWGMSVRKPDGKVVVHELFSGARPSSAR